MRPSPLPLVMIWLLLCAGSSLYGYTVEVQSVHSAAMQRDIPALFILPDSYAADSTRHFPVLYLLHGYGGDYRNWEHLTTVEDLADRYQMIIVCPDGASDSWYIDSPLDSTSRYETHVAIEVVAFTDRHYRSIAARTGRAISGLSMGGHGALFLALRHPEIFGAAGSTSGGVDLRPFPGKWHLSEKIGSIDTYPARWDSLSVAGNIARLRQANLVLLIDCGVEDIFIDVNRALHRALLDAGVPHEYIERPGGHNWAYWANAIDYQALFFRNYFSREGDGQP